MALRLAAPIATQKSEACNTPRHREFDFWLGTWDVFERGSTTKIPDVVVTSELDGCVIRELYKKRCGLMGESLSSYDAKTIVAGDVVDQSWPAAGHPRSA